MGGLEKSAPPIGAAAAAFMSPLDYLSPEAFAWLPESARDKMTERLILGLQAIAALLCFLVLVQLFWTESPLQHRDSIYILLASLACLLILGTAQRLRRNRRERQVCESVQRVADTALAADVGLWRWNPKGDRFRGTPTCLSILGLHEDTMTLRQAISHLDPDGQATVREMVDEVARTHQSRECTCRRPDENGWLRFRISAGPTDEDDYLSGCVTSMAVPRELEAEVANLRSSLTHLTRVGLLGQLGGALAHELKQPLTAILSNAQALQRMVQREEMDMPEIRAIIGDIIQDDSRAAAVIEHLRSLLKPGEFDGRLLELNDIVRDTLELVHNELINRKIAVSTSLDQSRLCLKADTVQLQQLLLNLIFNAADAMASAEGSMLTITTGPAEGQSVHLSVSDNGPGLSEAMMNRLFEPFVSTKVQGVGLGLSISRAIVLSHKGRIWAENNPAGGATFHMTFPRVTGPS